MKTIGLVANFDQSRSIEAVRQVCELAHSLGFDIHVEERIASYCPVAKSCAVERFAERGVESVVVLGGDGTMLDAAHRTAGQQLPMMGLNTGSLGYLTSVEEQYFAEALRQLRENRYAVSLRSALSLRVVNERGEENILADALNDVVVTRCNSGVALPMELRLNNRAVAQMLCDGIIVATPTGSTAYSLSAGGPILLPDTPALVISMICPHTLTARPLVIRDSIKVGIRSHSDISPVIVSRDGQKVAELRQQETAVIQRSQRDIPLIELHGYDACDVLCRKLGWCKRQPR